MLQGLSHLGMNAFQLAQRGRAFCADSGLFIREKAIDQRGDDLRKNSRVKLAKFVGGIRPQGLVRIVSQHADEFGNPLLGRLGLGWL